MKRKTYSTKEQPKVYPQKTAKVYPTQTKKPYTKPTIKRLRVNLNQLLQCPSCLAELTPSNRPIRLNDKIECELCM